MREIIIRWLDEAAKLNYGDKLNLVANNKKEQEVLFSEINKELKVMREIDPVKGATLLPFKMFKNGRFWVGVEKILSIPTMGFIRKANGKVEKIELAAIDYERDRRIRLMCEDGYSLEKIEELEGPLTPEEISEIRFAKEG
ncbi:MAG: hypothetical protein WDA47_04640 [Bacilli bacterium]